MFDRTVRQLIQSEKNWTQGWYYRNKFGIVCLVGEAHAYCLTAAIDLAYRDVLPVYEKVADYIERNYDMETAFHESCAERKIIMWNDAHKRTYSEIKKLIDDLNL